MATLATFWLAAHEKYSWKFLNKTLVIHVLLKNAIKETSNRKTKVVCKTKRVGHRSILAQQISEENKSVFQLVK